MIRRGGTDAHSFRDTHISMSNEQLSEETARDFFLAGDRDSLDRMFREHTDLAASTARNYRAGWENFVSWCDRNDRESLPARPESVADFLEDQSTLAMDTLKNRLSAIRHAHRLSGESDPTKAGDVREKRREISKQKREESWERSPAVKTDRRPSEIMEGGSSLLRDHLASAFLSENADDSTGTNSDEKQKRDREKARNTWMDPYVKSKETDLSALTEKQRALIPEPEYDLEVMRDRAVLLLMASLGAPRTWVRRADIRDLFVEDDNVVLGIRKKNGMPETVLEIGPEEDLRFCPARALTAWTVGANITSGSLFRAFTSHGSLKQTRIATSSINRIVRSAAESAGFDPDQWSPKRLKN